jgi:DASS family divalent anion:Na+ symporter
VFGISALLTKSGLAYRLSIGLLRLVPKGRLWYSFSLFMVGVLLTPLVPSKGGRISILQPFLIELINLGDRSKRNDTATQFMTSAVLGISLMSPIFLTGSAMNLVMFGLLDEQTRFTFNWLYWLFVASLPGLLLMLGYVLLMWVLFRDGQQIDLSKEKLKEQGKALGGMSAVESGTLITLVSMVVLIPSVKFHMIEVPWLLLGISVILLLFGVIGNKDFKNGIDWPILVFIGSVLAWPGVIAMIGMDDLIVDLLEPVGWYMKNEFFLFAIFLSLAIMGLRLFLPRPVAVVVAATTLMPVANESGISPWVIGFIVLMMVEASIFAYQDIQRVQAESALELHGLAGVLNTGKANLAYLIMALLRIAVILVSVPIWSKLDII